MDMVALLNTPAVGDAITAIVVGVMLLLKQKHVIDRVYNSVPTDVLHLLRDGAQMAVTKHVDASLLATDMAKVAADVAAPAPVPPAAASQETPK